MAIANLILEDGSIFEGISIGFPGVTYAEVVFNTGMTGYQEILTDSSYTNQILILTSPHVGNVGINKEDSESMLIRAAGLAVKNFSDIPSNWRSHKSLSEYLHENSIVGISNIDTRAVVHLIRKQGVMQGCLITGDYNIKEIIRKLKNSNNCKMNAAYKISTKRPYIWHTSTALTQKSLRIVVIDFGVKYSILNHLKKLDVEVIVIPATTPCSEILKLKPHGIILSNGPGDPTVYKETITTIKTLLNSGLVIFGICLGCQLLALALDAVTVKMKHGHRGINHPVQDLSNNQVLITSQNHGFVIDEHTLPKIIEITHRSLFDGSVQGIKHKYKPIFGFQGHPEGGPGPSDLKKLFSFFIHQIYQNSYHAKTL